MFKFIGYLVALHGALLCLGRKLDLSDNAEPYNYDFKGETFLNTQKTDYCLLARINGSIIISHKPTDTTKEIFVPKDASNKNSRCDYNFESILQLSFGEITYKLYFARNIIPILKTKAIYCDDCDDGSWTLKRIEILINNASNLVPSFPATKINAKAGSELLNNEAGDFVTGINLQRGYKCNDKELYADLEIEDSKDLSIITTKKEDWNISVRFYDVRVQPFLVIDRTIKDPVLCTDYTVFIVLIIVLPIFYFTIFIIVYRLKERYGSHPSVDENEAKEKHYKKQLVKTNIDEVSSRSYRDEESSAISPTIILTPAGKTSTPAMRHF